MLLRESHVDLKQRYEKLHAECETLRTRAKYETKKAAERSERKYGSLRENHVALKLKCRTLEDELRSVRIKCGQMEATWVPKGRRDDRGRADERSSPDGAGVSYECVLAENEQLRKRLLSLTEKMRANDIRASPYSKSVKPSASPSSTFRDTGNAGAGQLIEDSDSLRSLSALLQQLRGRLAVTEAEQGRVTMAPYGEMLSTKSVARLDVGRHATIERTMPRKEVERSQVSSPFNGAQTPEVPPPISSPQAHALLHQMREENCSLKVRHARMLNHVIVALREVCLEAADFCAIGGIQSALGQNGDDHSVD